MSHKYTLKDMLLEAGVREYYGTPAAKGWKPSEKHTAAMEKLYDKQLTLTERIRLRPLYKWLAVAASFAVLVGILASIKPVREGIAAMFGGRNGPDTGLTQPDATVTDSETSAKETTAGETTAEETAEPDTSAVTETTDTDPLDEYEGLEGKALAEAIIDDITSKGITPERWTRLWSISRASGDTSHYKVPEDVSPDDPLFSVLLGMNWYDEDSPARRAFCSSVCSIILERAWIAAFGDDPSSDRIPYPTKYLAQPEQYKNGYEDGFADDANWLFRYAEGMEKYAKYLPREEVREKYPYSFRVLEISGFTGFADGAVNQIEKAVRTLKEFFEMAQSVKYGVPVSDGNSKIYQQFDEGGGLVYEYGSSGSIYEAVRRFYSEEELGRIAPAPQLSEQREGIKTFDKWRAYFVSLSSEKIADSFIKESKRFFTTADGLVLTSTAQSFESLSETLSDVKTSGGTLTATVHVTGPSGSADYTVIFEEDGGNMRLTDGTLITRWLFEDGIATPD